MTEIYRRDMFIDLTRVLLYISIGIFSIVLLSACASVDEADEREKELDKEESEYSFDYRIASWFGFTQSACSVTFDDGTLDQYLLAFPELEARSIEATFFLITAPRDEGVWQDGDRERMLFSWEQARTLSSAGHEIASHGSTHIDLTQNSTDAALELKRSKDTILDHLPTLPKGMTFSWPYWRSTPMLQKLAHSYYIGARSGGGDIDYYRMRFDGIPQKTPQNYFRVNSMRVSETFASRKMKSLCSKTFEDGNWLIVDFHGITDGNIPKEALGWDPISLENFRRALDYLTAKDFWIAPFGTVLRYIKERDAASITFVRRTHNTVSFTAVDGLDDEVFSHPLSVEIFVPEEWHAVDVYRNGSYKSSAVVDGGRVRCSIQPDGSTIQLVRKPSAYSVFLNEAGTHPASHPE